MSCPSNLFAGENSRGSSPSVVTLGCLTHRAVSSVPGPLLFSGGGVDKMTWFDGITAMSSLLHVVLA